ncbi:polysaccharide lyase family 8 super-sandwich domain-containing protein [Paenibacillus sp. HB172176]|uniref:polysaccharide lyase family 8 super-sandwich domain-containing protein n=1 Tax=Paenibacillus sp. HB172176 TaxID=2493690 RepID=UPI00143C9489|nr:polysaccharide lyase family 8 super-sandwich domain-containing protein [Paenibacillus sp. HB172176]
MARTRSGRRGLSLALAMILISNLLYSVGTPAAKAAEQSYTVIASQDNFVRKSASTGPDYSNMTNGGETAKAAYLNVKGINTSSPREAYLQFDLADYPEHITSAELYLYGNNGESSTNTVTANVYGLDMPGADDWNESTVTWNTKPGLGSNQLGTMTFPGKASPNWTALDVTAYIQSQLGSDKIASFAVAGTDALTRIESRSTYINDSSGNKAKPYLVIHGTPALKSVVLTADRPSAGLGETINLSVSGMLDTNAAADLSEAAITYASDNASFVIDDAAAGAARAVSGGSAVITASVTLDGYTKTATLTLLADGFPPGELANLAGGVSNGEYTLSWTNPSDDDFAGVRIYDGDELVGSAEAGETSFMPTGLTAGESYTFLFRTLDEAGNLSTGTPYSFVYEEPNVLDEVTLTASAGVVKPGESVSFSVTGTMKSGQEADLSSAEVAYVSDSGSLVFTDSGASVADAVYAGAARIHAVATLDGVTRESAPVLVRVYPSAQDEFDALRIKYGERLTGYDPDEPYSVFDPDVRGVIEKLDGDARKYWEAMDKTSFMWGDLSPATKSGDLSTAAARLRAMAKAWATYGTSVYLDEAMLGDMLEAWNRFYTTYYNENTSMSGNWFDFLVNVPNNINDSMILMYDAIPYSEHPDLIDKLNRAIDTFNPVVTRTGANRIYISKVMMLRGITGKDSNKIAAGSAGLSEVFPNVTSGDGFYDDGSFIQHDYFPYAGGYGKALLQDLTEALWLVSGSPWDNVDPQKTNIFDWYFNAFEPNLFNGQIINAIDGREISRDYNFGGYAIMNALLLQTEMAGNPYAEKQRSAIKHHLESGSVDSFLSTGTIWNIQQAKKLLNDPDVQTYAPPEGNFLFYNQDNVVQRGEDWLYSISMHSDRMANYETVNNENLKGWYEADGMTQLYLDPLDYLSLFWITVDPSRLPGITVDRDENRPPATNENRPYVDSSKYAGDGELMENSWTGGVSLDGLYGTAGMDFKQHDYSDMDVSAKKSWFMFDDEIVALGAGINSSSDREIETIVENRTLNSAGDNKLTVDGEIDGTPMGVQSTLGDTNWIQLEGTGGYVFPNGADVQMLREEREGKSTDINQRFIIPGNDEFNSTVQSTSWSWIREDGSHHGLTGSKLQIAAQPGTLKGSANSTSNLLQTSAPKEDFYVTTAVDFAPAQAEQEAGILIRKDDDNYVSLAMGRTAANEDRIIAVNEVDGIAQIMDFPLPASGELFLKLDKSGDRYTVYGSDSEASWGEPLYTFTNGMAGDDRLNTGLMMGLYAQNGSGGAAEATASFDYFHLLHTRNYMTLWLEHGIQPQDETYSYIQLPKQDAAEVAAYSAQPDAVILANTDEVQAAADTTLGVTGMNFWKSGILDSVKANQPSSIMMEEGDNTLKLAVSDPTQKQDAISFEIKKPGASVISKDSTVTVLQLSPTIKFKVDVTGDPGKTHHVVFAYDPAAEAADFSVPVLESVSFEDAFAVVAAGSEAEPGFIAKMDDNSEAELSAASIWYSSSNESVATVDSNGTVAGVAPGEARITAAITLNGVTKTAMLQIMVPTEEPSTATLQPVKDTFVRSGIYKEDSYDNDTKLYVKNAGGDDYREAYFTFDLSGIEGEIEAVRFHATGKLEDSGGTFVDTVVKPVLGGWEEGATAYANKPLLGKALGEPATFTGTDSEASFDITEYAREQMKQGATVDLALAQDVLVGRKMYVYASENSGKQPYLEIITHQFAANEQDSSIDPATKDFSKDTNSADYKDIVVTVSWNGNSLESIMQGSSSLQEGTDYTVVGNRITLTKEYLAAQSAGALELAFAFNAGANAELAIDIEAADTDSGTGSEDDNSDPGSGSDSDGSSGEDPGDNDGDSDQSPVANGNGVSLKAAMKSETVEGEAVKLQVDADILEQALEMIEGQEHQIIAIEAHASEAGLNLEMPASSIEDALERAPHAVLSIEAGAFAYKLPLQALRKAVEAGWLTLGGSEEPKLLLSIETVGEADGQAINNQAQEAGIQLLHTPIDFRLSLVGDGEERIIDDFGSAYVARTIVLDDTVNASQAGAYLYNPASGTFSFVPATFTEEDGKTIATLIRNGNSIYAIGENPRSFPDLIGHWARGDIEQLASKLIVNGVSEEAFEPERTITRAEFAALLVRGLGLSEDGDAPAFTDIVGDEWYAGAVGAAVRAGLVQGYEDGAFRPDATLTREQMAVMLIRAVDWVSGDTAVEAGDATLLPFGDRENISSWALPAVKKAVAMGLMNGMAENAFLPSAQATRAQTATTLLRVLQKLNFIN